ncbi:efflux RND transporter permease subunit [bacterium]|nr:efflux RND transporter permease subunit [bacterium]
MTAFVSRHRVLAGLLWLAVLAWGLFAQQTVPRREDPDIPIRFGQVVALWPGASTEQVENLLADRLERTLLALDDVQKIETRCRPGLAILKIQARDATTDLPVFWSQIRDRLADGQAALPEGVLPLQINDHFGDTSILIYGVVWPEASERRREDVARRIRDRLRVLAPLAEVSLIGAQAERIEVGLDSLQLARYRINPGQIAEALRNRNLLPQSGGLGEDVGQRWLTRSSLPLDLEGLGRLPITPQLRLSDLASLRRLPPDPASFRVRVQGQPSVAISVNMRKGEDILVTGRRVEAEVEKLRAELPPGCQLVKVNDLPTSVVGRISEFNHNLRDGVVLILLVTFAFMGWRSAALVGVMLPLTILGTYAAMQACGRDLQQMSITALIIALGLVVDNSVVVVDNIEHHLSQGQDPESAARQGAEGIRLPLLTSNLTTVAAFLPLAGLPGGKGDFIRDLGLVTSLATLVSLLLNLSLLPFLCRYFLRPLGPQSTSSGLSRLREGMAAAARRGLQHPGRTAALAALLSLLAVAVLPVLGVQFFPSAQRSQCVVEVWTRDGSSLESTGRSVAQVEKWLSGQAEVVNYIAYLGGGGPRFYYNVDPETGLSNYAQLVVNTRGVAQTEQLVSRLRTYSRGQFPEARVVPRKLEQGPPVGAPLALRLQGENGEQLRLVADRLVELLSRQKGVWLAYHDLGELAPQIDLDWDDQRLVEVGLSHQDVSQATRIALSGLTVTQLRQGDRELPVDLRSRAPLEDLTLFGPSGEVVPLGSLARLRIGPGVWRHSRYNRRPTCNIYGFTDDSRLPSKILADCLPQASALVPASMALSYGGEQEEVDKSLRELGLVFLSAVLGQLLIVAWEFNRLSLALSVLAAVPFSLFGGILGLAVTGNAFSFTAFLGLITLGGVVTNHAIMFFEYTRAELGQGKDVTSAMIRAGSLRMRPILLTILLSIGGLLPLAIGGGNLWPPMAWSLIFGLLYSLPLALVVVPSFYAWVSNLRWRFPRWLGVVLGLLVVGSAQAEPWTLQRVRQRVLERQPQLDQELARYRQAQARVEEMGASARPRLGLQSSFTYLNPTVQLAAPGFSLNGSVANNWSSGAYFEQQLANFGRTGWSVSSAEQSLSAVRQDYRGAWQRSWEEAALRFYELAERQAQLQVAESSVRVNRQGMEDARRRQKAGSAPRFEVLRAESDYQAAQLEAVEAAQALAVARTRLQALLDCTEVPEIVVESSDFSSPTNLAEAQREAARMRPELLSLQQQVGATQARAEQEAAQLNPSLGLRLDYLHQNPTAFRPGVSFQAGLVLSVPLYDGGQSEARSRQAEQESEALQSRLRQAEREVQVEVETLYYRLLNDQQSIEVSHSRRLSAQESERVARLRYQNGVSSQLEWLDAQRQRIAAEQGYVSAEYRLRADQARWWRALGRDPEGACRTPPCESVEQEKSLPSR